MFVATSWFIPPTLSIPPGTLVAVGVRRNWARPVLPSVWFTTDVNTPFQWNCPRELGGVSMGYLMFWNSKPPLIVCRPVILVTGEVLGCSDIRQTASGKARQTAIFRYLRDALDSEL